MFLFSIQLPLLAFDNHASELTGHTLVNHNLPSHDDIISCPIQCFGNGENVSVLKDFHIARVIKLKFLVIFCVLT